MRRRQKHPWRSLARAVAPWLLLLGAWTARPALAQGADAVEPPRVVTQVDAVYPASALQARRAATVVLRVTVTADGAVRAAEVADSGGADFDAAALAAIAGWRFAPARRAGVAVAAIIRVPFVFAPPPTAPPPVAPPAPTRREHALEVRVRGHRPTPPRAASDHVLERELLVAVPKASAGDMLQAAPGVYVARPEGDAVAQQIMLRGFDAEHGQDLAIAVAGVPVNQPSHLHGQGYADLNFVPPEVVREVRVREGVYDPRQGDFAVAGSVDLELGVVERGHRVSIGAGSFATRTLALLLAPEGEDEATFAAVQLRDSDGFGQGRGALSGALLAQLAFQGPRDLQGRVFVGAYAARAGLAGVLRQDDIDAGRVDLYGRYANPSATAQSASAGRLLAALELATLRPAGDRTTLLAYATLVDFRSRANFTGFVARSAQHPDWLGRGDLVEQRNRDVGVGAELRHRSAWLRPREGVRAQLELGVSLRGNGVAQQQAMLRQPQNQVWAEQVDADVRALDLGAFADADVELGGRWHLRGGGRLDLLAFEIDDRLGNRTPPSIAASHLPGHRRSAAGVALGPRGALEFRASDALALHLGYGEGFRSPQARSLDEGERAPFARVRSAEVGARYAPRGPEALQASAALFATALDADLAFDPGSARLERIGPTRRLGAALALQARPFPWLLAAASLTAVDATLQAPPPASVENPAPSLQAGDRLPDVPPVVARLDASAQRSLLDLAGAPLRGELGAGAHWMSARPLRFGAATPAVLLVDAAATLRWRALAWTVQVANALDARYAATAYAFVSDWQTTPLPSQLPARHVAAGAPRSVHATLQVSF